jgi:hypothetical protein
MPRSLVWPENVGVDEAATEPSRARRAPRPARSRPAVPPAAGSVPGPASPAAAEALAGGLAALGSGDIVHAALRLGVALRLEPDFADAVIDAVGERATDPQLALVAGDAYRLLGREGDALAAFDLARGHLDDLTGGAVEEQRGPS